MAFSYICQVERLLYGYHLYIYIPYRSKVYNRVPKAVSESPYLLEQYMTNYTIQYFIYVYHIFIGRMKY